MSDLPDSSVGYSKKDKNFEKAIKLYTSAANYGHVESLVILGIIYMKGRIRINNLSGKELTDWKLNKSKDYFEKAIFLGSIRALHELGMLFLSNESTFGNKIKEAIQLLKKASSKKYGSASYKLADFYAEGDIVKKNIPLSIYYYEKAIKQGITEATIELVYMYNTYIGDTQRAKKLCKVYIKNEKKPDPAIYNLLGTIYLKEKNYVKAEETLLIAQKQGFEYAYITLANMLYKRVGQNIKAKKVYENAAKKGNLIAKAFLAELCIEGPDGLRDFTRADKLYDEVTRDAKMKDPNIIAAYANYLETGTILKKNIRKALQLYERAAKLGSGEAYNKLGSISAEGIGIRQSYQKAVKYFEKAAELDNVNAILNLAMMYEKERGVEKNDKKLAELHQKGVTLGLKIVDGKLMQDSPVSDIKRLTKASSIENLW